jgi:GAF domain-containing protein
MFTERQIAMLLTFADQAVIAIENVRLFKELQSRTQDLARSVERLQALSEVSQAVNSTLDLEKVLSTIVARAVELSSTDGGAIYEYDQEKGEFTPRATYRLPEEVVEALLATPLRIGEGAIGQAVVAQAPVEIPDMRVDSYASPVRALLEKYEYRASLQCHCYVRIPFSVQSLFNEKASAILARRLFPCCRPLQHSPLSQYRTHACSARSRKRATSWRSRASTSHSSWPT